MARDEIADAFRSTMRLGDSFQLNDGMTFDDVPGWDSIGHLNLVTELEGRFGITFDMEEIVGIDSVRAVRELVARKRGAAA